MQDAETTDPEAWRREIRRLREREQQLTRLLHSATDAVVAIDTEGRVTQWNHGAQRLLGWSAAQALGQPLVDLIVPPEWRQAHADGLARYRRTGASQVLHRVMDVQALCRDGRRLAAELSIWPLEDEGRLLGFGAFLRDVTERREAEERLRQTSERYRQVVENLGEGMGIIQDGVTVFVNPRAAKLLGRRAEDMVGTPFLEWVHPDDRDEVAARQRRRQAGEEVTPSYELRCVRGDGAVRWMATQASSLTWEGRPATMTFFADVTEQRAMIDALHRSEERYRLVIEHVGEGMVVVQGERFVFANQRAAAIAEMSVAELLEHGYLHRIHPEDRALVDRRRLQRLQGQDVPSRYEIRLAMPDGRVKWVDIGVTLVPWEGGQATLTFFSDISERKRLEARLTRTLDERETILNTSLAGIAFLTPQGRFRWANPAMLQLFGATDTVGFSSMERVYLSREDYLRVGGEVVRAIEQGLRYRTELPMRRLDGRVIWVALSGQAVRPGDLSAGTVWTALDITERKQAEEDIRQALAQQTELNQLRNQFVSMTSHEFRTPLATILSSVELLRDYGPRISAEEQAELIESVTDSVHRMAGMLDRVLFLGKTEAGMLAYEPQPLDPAAWMADEMARLEATEARAPDTRLVWHHAPLPPVAWVDGKLLRHMLDNLVANALKYSPEGGEVRVELTQQAQWLVLRVHDQGLGIPAKDLPHLFASFHRASNVGHIKGTGLGLAIVRHAVELHGGRVEVESQLGRGSCFTVWLPLHTQASEATR